MRTIFLIFLLALTNHLSAIAIDSTKRAEMIAEGRAELCNLLEYNAHVESPLDRKFLVVIDGDPNGVNYTFEKNIDSNEDILDQATVDAINDTMAAAYEAFNVELYIIVIRSFDLVFKTELPAYPQARDIFTNRLYDETSNITMLRATHQQISYEIAYGSMARTKDYIVYSRAEYKSVYAPGKIGAWDLTRTIPIYGTTETYPKLDELTQCFYSRFNNDPAVMQGGLQYSVKAVAARFYESAKYMAVKGAIMSTYTSPSMSAIFIQFRTVDYEGLTEPERRHALSVFAGYSMGDNGLEQEERYACRIVESTPSQQVPDFLDHLSQVSSLNTDPSYMGDKPNKALIKMLVERIDDHVFTGDCYAWFMRAIIQIEMTCPQVVEAKLPTTDADWYNRRIYWDDWSALANPKDGDHDYEIDLADNGSVSVHKSVAWLERRPVPLAPDAYTNHAHWDNTYAPFTLDPFAIVVFTNRSSLGMLQIAGAQPNKPYFAPAIFLQYADDKAFNTNAITTTALIIDAITIATAGPLINAALEAGNVAMACFEALQFVGSVANIGANAINDPHLTEAVNTFNIIIGIWGLSKVAVYGAQYTVEFIAKARALELKPVPLSLAQEYRTQYAGVSNWTGVDNTAKQQLTKLDDLLEQQVEAGTLISTTKYSRNVVDALVGFEDQIASLAQSHGLTLQEFLVLEEKAFQQLTLAEQDIMNTIRDAIAKPTATTVMQKAIPKSDIGKYLDGSYTSCKGFMATAQDSKHLTTFEDIYYGMRLDYSQTAFHLSDGSCGVIRFKAQNSVTAVIPRCPANGGVEIASMPFTGHGFTSANNGRLGVPEWQMSGFAVMESAELWEVFSDGQEILRATYNKNLGKFVPTP